MITLSIILLVLYVISIYKLKEEDWDFYNLDSIWGIIATVGTYLVLITFATTLIILMIKYLP
jgi:hypothetical protein